MAASDGQGKPLLRLGEIELCCECPGDLLDGRPPTVSITELLDTNGIEWEFAEAVTPVLPLVATFEIPSAVACYRVEPCRGRYGVLGGWYSRTGAVPSQA